MKNFVFVLVLLGGLLNFPVTNVSWSSEPIQGLNPIQFLINLDEGEHHTLGSTFLVDLDGDNDNDLVVGLSDGRLNYYRNESTDESSLTLFSKMEGVQNPFNSVDGGNYSIPILADMDEDNDDDLILYASTSPSKTDPDYVYYFRNDSADPSSGDFRFKMVLEREKDPLPGTKWAYWEGKPMKFFHVLTRPTEPIKIRTNLDER